MKHISNKTLKNKKKKKNKKNKKSKTRKWTMKYKRSINCKKPKGFSQKQYCKYGRKKGGGVVTDDPELRLPPPDVYESWNEDFFLDFIEQSNNVEDLRTIIHHLNEINNIDGTLIHTSKAGYMAIKKYNRITEYGSELYSWLQDQANFIISDSSPNNPINGVEYFGENGKELIGSDRHEQFRI